MVIKLENCFVNIKDESEYLNKIESALSSNVTTSFFYLNSYSYYLANRNEDFKNSFNKAEFIIADGYSIVWLAKILYGINIKKVVFTYSFFKDVNKIFEKSRTSIFLLGGSHETIEKAASIMNSNNYNLNIVGCSNGYFDQTTESDEIISKINISNAEVLICGMGMPKCEIWIQNNIKKLNVKCIFSVGSFFELLTENKKIAPKWMYNSGFEWIFRLIQEPKRLFKRYIFANTYLIISSLKSLFYKRVLKISL